MMGFVRTRDNALISLIDVRRLMVVEQDGHSVVMAEPRDGSAPIELCRSYTIESLQRGLDPTRAHR